MCVCENKHFKTSVFLNSILQYIWMMVYLFPTPHRSSALPVLFDIFHCSFYCSLFSYKCNNLNIINNGEIFFCFC